MAPSFLQRENYKDNSEKTVVLNEPGLFVLLRMISPLNKARAEICIYLLRAEEISYDWLGLLVSLLLTQQEFELSLTDIYGRRRNLQMGYNCWKWADDFVEEGEFIDYNQFQEHSDKHPDLT